MGKKADITHCLQIINFYDLPEVFEMGGDGGKIYDYCIRQGAKNNLGMFTEHRGAIAFKLRVDEQACLDYFINNPKWIGFCPDTHLIWVKKLYKYIDFGLMNDVRKKVKDKKTGEVKEILSWNSGIYPKINFVNKIWSVIKNDQMIREHPFLQSYLQSYQQWFEIMNEDLKSVAGNKVNMDKILKLLTGI